MAEGQLEQYLASAIGLWSLIWPAAIFFALLAVVTKRTRVIEATRRTSREFVTNIGLAFGYTIFLAPLFVIPTKAVHDLIPSHPPMVAFWESEPKLIALTAAVLAVEFAAYWRHRLEHLPWLWPIHATHHADEAIHWLTVYRKHPLSKILAGVLDITILLLLGLPLWSIGVAMLLRTWWGFFIHADVNWTLGKVGEFMISPAAHRLHHIRDERLMGSNYGNTFTLFDRLFGTYVDPKPYIGCEVGIEEGTRGFLGELWRPFERRYWAGFLRSEKAEDSTVDRTPLEKRGP